MRSDPRLDFQQSRAPYYADLVRELGVDVASLLDHAAADPDATLAVEVLAELAGRDDPIATELLARPDREPEVTVGMLDYLRDFPDWCGANLNLAAATRLAEHLHDRKDLVYDVDIVPEFWDPWRQRIPLVEQAHIDAAALAAANAAAAPAPYRGELCDMTTDELLTEFESQPAKRLLAELRRRESEEDRAFLVDAVLHRSASASVRAAARALGAMGDLRLLDLAEELFASTEYSTDGSALTPEQRTRRAALLWYVSILPAEHVLPLAREWWPRGRYFRVAAGHVLADHAEPRDRGWLEDALRRSLAHGTGEKWIGEINAIARIGDRRSVPLLTEISERVTCTWARIRALHGLGGILGSCPPVDEALWDCEDDAREIGCRHGAIRTSAAANRLRELAAAPFEDDAVRQAAAVRIPA